MRWTGGQYSFYRAALAVVATSWLFDAIGAPGHPVATAGFVLALGLSACLALGWRDRLAAQLLAPAVLFAEIVARSPDTQPEILALFAGRTALLPTLLLLAHARVPQAPFGSLEARGRIDPRGGWQRPAWQTRIGWSVLAVVFGARLFERLGDGAPLVLAAAAFELALATAGLFAHGIRRESWSVLVLFRIACLAALGSSPGEGGLALALLLACEPSRWEGRSLRSDLPAAAASSEALPPRLFYDGDCGFCHRSVRFVLAEELATPASARLRFAPLGSETFRARLAAHPELDPGALPDSIVLELEDGTILTRSAAALEIASRLGGGWRLLALFGRCLPGRLLDAGYDAIASIRKRLFAAPKDACPILPPDMRARFDP